VLAALNLAFDVADQAPAAAIQLASTPDAVDPRLDGLLKRLDNALGDDGRLI